MECEAIGPSGGRLGVGLARPLACLVVDEPASRPATAQPASPRTDGIAARLAGLGAQTSRRGARRSTPQTRPATDRPAPDCALASQLLARRAPPAPVASRPPPAGADRQAARRPLGCCRLPVPRPARTHGEPAPSRSRRGPAPRRLLIRSPVGTLPPHLPSKRIHVSRPHGAAPRPPPEIPRIRQPPRIIHMWVPYHFVSLK